MTDHRKPPDKGPGASYEVGYGKPPAHTRFQPGQSGNPRGRTKGTKNLKTDLMEELGERILVREGDQSHRISKQRAMLKALMSKTLKGDARAAALLLSMIMRLVDTGEGTPEVNEPLLDDEREILRAFEDRVRRSDSDGPVALPDSGAESEDPS